MKSLSRYFILGMLMFLSSGLFPVYKAAGNDLLEGTEFPKQYLLVLSGTVMDETFSGAQALLTLMPPVPGSNNPYQITIDGFPATNSRNSFFWNSENSEMTAIASEITCEIKRTFLKPSPMYFVFLSPGLLKHTGALTGEEGRRYAERTALPTLVYAGAGGLKLRIYSNTVSGTIWMKGYDPVEKAHIQYSATLHGNKTYKLQPSRELGK